MRSSAVRTCGIVLLLCAPISLLSQGSPADYERARNLRVGTQGLVYNLAERVTWIEKSHRFWYRKSVKGGNLFMLVDADALSRQPAFDHEKLAASLSAAAGQKYTAITLPFNSFSFVEGSAAITFQAADAVWKCELSSYACAKTSDALAPQPGAGRGGPPPGAGARGPSPEPQARISPDGKSEAFTRSYNVWMRNRETKAETQLSWDGTVENYYSMNMQWAPDSLKLAVFRTKAGYKREVHFIQSSPEDQLQPKHSSILYNKPGDVIDINMPVLFRIDTRKQIAIDNDLFAVPFINEQIRWWRDSRAFTFEYNQRGHQVYRIIEVDAETGKARALINEETKTFFCYSSKRYRYDLSDGNEIIWMSERDGWNHLYLYDSLSGAVKNQITRGEWVVRGVDRIDESARQIWFRASGMVSGKDPYFVHYYRINFDGAGLTALTHADGTHAIAYPSAGRGGGRGGVGEQARGAFSADFAFYVDAYSRIDLPAVLELHRTSDQKVVMEVERGDMQDLVKSGWIGPETFVAKGRDGKTDIWGIIYRPRTLNPGQKYPVVENIYAGPQDSHVPKAFSPYNPMQSLAELGFIVVQIDAMGTSNRSKAFHDVAWKNLGDGGFPDRIWWHKAVAARYPYYDISRVGIYGTSAGGQNAMGALLFHPEFYKVAVSNCGCHDNRMDKIGWNEQWMGYPVGPEYSASSNVDNAHKLRGKLLLVVGEMDNNVDPASTFQVCNALIKAGKYFDLLVVPNGGHGEGGEYGVRKRNDFFVRHLLGVAPPDWNK